MSSNTNTKLLSIVCPMLINPLESYIEIILNKKDSMTR